MAEKSNPSARERDRQNTQSETSEEAGISSEASADQPNASTEEAKQAPKAGAPPAGQAGKSQAGTSQTGTSQADASKTGTSKTGTSQQGTPQRSRSAQEHISLKSIASLERLRDRVETAAHELKRLRDENQALVDRVKELESRPEVEARGTFLSLEHDPELLRRKINGFIEAIDRYLENERKRS